jgi:hypothetical protein
MAQAYGAQQMTNSQIIAELNRAKCEFQLRNICAVMDIDPSRVKPSLPSNNHANAPDFIAASAEQPMNITVFDGDLTAKLPRWKSS